MGRGAPPGPRVPRKGTATKRSREAIEGVAFQIGVMVAIERNRWKLNQYELAQKVGTDQISVSNIENGKPATRGHRTPDRQTVQGTRPQGRQGPSQLLEVVVRQRIAGGFRPVTVK